jgi:hypothetical protein
MPQLCAEILCQDRGGLSGKNLSIRPDHGKRYILVMSHSIDIFKTASSAPPPDSSSSNDPQFQGFGGETIPIQLRL